MKKFLMGLILGIVLSLCSVTYANSGISAFLFPAKLVINGNQVSLGEEYPILNYNGHAYLPIRYVGEYIGGYIDYKEETQTIALNYFPGGKAILTDDVFPLFHVGNVQAVVDGSKSKITGLMAVEKSEQKRRNMVAFALRFLDKEGQLLGSYVQGVRFIENEEIQYFEGEVEGDLSAYSTILLDTGIFNHTKLPEHQ